MYVHINGLVFHTMTRHGHRSNSCSINNKACRPVQRSLLVIQRACQEELVYDHFMTVIVYVSCSHQHNHQILFIEYLAPKFYHQFLFYPLATVYASMSESLRQYAVLVIAGKTANHFPVLAGLKQVSSNSFCFLPFSIFFKPFFSYLLCMSEVKNVPNK